MSTPCSMDEQIQAYFDGELAPEEEAKLGAWLEAAPGNREEFFRQLDVHASLWERRLAGEVDIPPVPLRIGAGLRAGRLDPSGVLRWVCAAAIAALVLLAPILFYLASEDVPATATESKGLQSDREGTGPGALVSEAVGEIRVLREGKERRVLPGNRVPWTGRLIVPELARLRLELPEKNLSLCLGESTELDMKESDNGSQLTISRGYLVAEVTGRERERALRFFTPNAEAAAWEARFLLSADGDGSRLEVWAGHVRFRRLHSNEEVNLSAVEAASALSDSLRKELSAECIWEDGFEDMSAWDASPVKKLPAAIEPLADRILARSGRQALRLSYRTPRQPPLPAAPEHLFHPDLRYVARRIRLPKGGTVLRCWVRLRSASPGATLVFMLRGKEKRWRWQTQLAELPRTWQLLTFALPEDAQHWSPETGPILPPGAPAPRAEDVEHLLLGGLGGDFDLCLDDLAILLQGSRSGPQLPE